MSAPRCPSVNENTACLRKAIPEFDILGLPKAMIETANAAVQRAGKRHVPSEEAIPVRRNATALVCGVKLFQIGFLENRDDRLIRSVDSPDPAENDRAFWCSGCGAAMLTQEIWRDRHRVDGHHEPR